MEGYKMKKRLQVASGLGNLTKTPKPRVNALCKIFLKPTKAYVLIIIHFINESKKHIGKIEQYLITYQFILLLFVYLYVYSDKKQTR